LIVVLIGVPVFYMWKAFDKKGVQSIKD
jgi:hypothetical protein